MTSIEWLQEQLNPDMRTMHGNIIQGLLEKAKEMHKQEIINTFKYSYLIGEDDISEFDAEFESKEYYQETFVSKKKIKFTEEEWSKLNNESKGSHNSVNLSDSDFSKQTLSDKYKEYKDWLNEIPELSDEIIFDFAKECALEDLITSIDSFVLGAKWYKEQLKNK